MLTNTFSKSLISIIHMFKIIYIQVSQDLQDVSINLAEFLIGKAELL